MYLILLRNITCLSNLRYKIAQLVPDVQVECIYIVHLVVEWRLKYTYHRRTNGTYFHGVQIFAIFAKEFQTAKINTQENLSWHYFADSHFLDPKSHQQCRHTHTDACSYTEYALNRIIANLNFQNCENKICEKVFLSAFHSNS